MEDRARAILGVEPGASRDGLRSAYRRVARECHPDFNPEDPGSQERFKDALAAYKLLAEGTRDARLLGKPETEPKTDESAYNTDNSWGYFLWWREKYF